MGLSTEGKEIMENGSHEANVYYLLGEKGEFRIKSWYGLLVQLPIILYTGIEKLRAITSKKKTSFVVQTLFENIFTVFRRNIHLVKLVLLKHYQQDGLV